MSFIFSMPKSIREASLRGKKVLLRADFNVPFKHESGEILDNTRIVQVIPTIKFLTSQGAHLSIISHLGRPKSEPDRKKYSFGRLLSSIQLLLSNFEISFVSNIFDAKRLSSQKSNEVFLLENIRFHDAETDTDIDRRLGFAKKISENFDLYVNDAFSASHREHASVTEIPKYLPSYMGFLLEEEITQLKSLYENIKKPYVAIVGGAKVSTKIETLRGLIKRADTILIGGAMAYTFLKSRASEIGNSLFERKYLPTAFQIIDEAAYYRKEILLPIDHIVAKKIDETSKARTVKQNIPDGFMGGDIGQKTLRLYIKRIQSAKTVFWNGPMGVFEIPKFSKGTVALAKAVATTKAKTVVGGGDSIHALKLAGVTDKINHVSGGGGAALEFLENPNLPGIKILTAHEL